MEFEFRFDKPHTQRRPRKDPDGPCRILIMGDFSGLGSRGSSNEGIRPADKSVLAVDIDNFQDMMSRLAPQLRMVLDEDTGTEVSVAFRQLDDFHPDRLYKSLEIFQALRETRERLMNPATFEETAAQLTGKTLPESGEGSTRVTKTQAENIKEDESSMFERLLGKQPAELSKSHPRLDISRFIKRIVEPHISPITDAQQDRYVASVDEATSESMRSILHHSAFQGLEAAWRALYWLISDPTTAEQIKVYLLDVGKEELAADISEAGVDLRASNVYRLLVERGVQIPGEEPWSALVGNYTFGHSGDDVALLAAMGAIASQSGGPFIAGAASETLGCRSLVDTPDPRDWNPIDSESEQRWQALRNSSVASWIGLALPRVLLRLPYGTKTEPIEQFEFEELTLGRKHQTYLWGNPGFACARLIARNLVERDQYTPQDYLEIDDLPAHTYRKNGESKMQPCAEVLLSERAAEAILNRGVMPILSYRNRNSVRLAGFQALADPPRALSGLKS